MYRIPEPSRRTVLLAGAGSLLFSATSAWATPWPVQATGTAPALTALNEVVESGARIGALRAIAVAHEGRLVAQRTYGGAAPDSLFRINSATKSVSSMLVGIALAQGKLRSLSQTLGELLPQAATALPGSAAAGVTLGQVLGGTTGLAYDWTTHFRDLAKAPDPVQYAFALERDARLSTGSWSYNDAAVGLISPILERAYGLPLDEVARRNLFAPLGIESFEWERDRAGRAIAYGGLRLRVNDLLKLAWTMANGGLWQGAQVVPAEWVAASTRPHVSGAWPNPPIADSGYGYLWFTGNYKGVPVSWAWGYGAQFALLAPSLRLAVATAAAEPAPQQLPAQNQAVATLVTRVLDALI
jgi:CubicO group peptidase (beta-lactamase class C family)